MAALLVLSPSGGEFYKKKQGAGNNCLFISLLLFKPLDFYTCKIKDIPYSVKTTVHAPN